MIDIQSSTIFYVLFFILWGATCYAMGRASSISESHRNLQSLVNTLNEIVNAPKVSSPPADKTSNGGKN